MSQIKLDPATAHVLRNAEAPVTLLDEAGNVLGRFVPLERGPEPTISEEELDRREQEGGGRPLRDILADLEKRYGL
jgi:hypothetical protein